MHGRGGQRFLDGAAITVIIVWLAQPNAGSDSVRIMAGLVIAALAPLTSRCGSEVWRAPRS